MAGAGEKTEKATPKKRDDARKKGQVAKSADLNGSVVLIASLIALLVFGGTLVTHIAEDMRRNFGLIAHPEIVEARGLGSLLAGSLADAAKAAAPIAAACLIAGVLANIAQVKWKPSAQALKPQASRINPKNGFKRVFGVQALVETLKAVAKVSVVAVIAALAIGPKLAEFGSMVGISPGALSTILGDTIMGIAVRVAVGYLVIAAADFAWQKYKHEKDLRMDHQEVKEEQKQHQLPPEVRMAVRRRQMEAARARMMAAVPTADVVVTNPTHFSVALRYVPAKLAPEVVAKGQDLVALQIRRIAAEHDVPIVPDPPLARSLYGSVEVGHVIPEELYQAVAQLLAFVYRLNGRRRALA